MPMMASLTISGLTHYDPTIWDDMQLPVPPIDPDDIGLSAGQLRNAWTIDKNSLVNYIGLVTMGMPLAYPDADFLKAAIQTWSIINLPTWQRIFDTMFYKYKPIWNKDGSYTESGNSRSTDSGSNTTSRTSAMNDTQYTHGYNDGTTTIDGLSWTHANKDIATGNDTSTITLGAINNITDSRQRTEKGNIGVTTTQQMIREEQELAMTNIYEIIADSFKRFFCVMIY